MLLYCGGWIIEGLLWCGYCLMRSDIGMSWRGGRAILTVAKTAVGSTSNVQSTYHYHELHHTHVMRLNHHKAKSRWRRGDVILEYRATDTPPANIRIPNTPKALTLRHSTVPPLLVVNLCTFCIVLPWIPSSLHNVKNITDHIHELYS